MKAKVIRRLTGKVIVEFATEQLDEIMDASSFFDLTDEEAKDLWEQLWDGVKGKEIYGISATTTGFMVQVQNEFIDWEA